MAVARVLAALPEGGGQLPPELAGRLSRQLDGLSETRILDALRDSGMDSVKPVAIDLLAEAGRLGDGAAHNPARLGELLKNLDRDSTLACVEGGGSGFQEVQRSRSGGVFGKEGLNWSELEKRAEEEKLFAAGAVVAVMTIFISALVLIDTGYRWVMALLYNRKACRIPCDLKVGKRTINGLIITLGKGGCRFHPLNTMAFDEVLTDMRGSLTVIRVEGTELQARSSGIYDTVTDFRFEKPITIKQQKALLEHSTISPYYIRKGRNGGESATEHLIG
ncbi:hypothetical protein [Antarctobacter jejuensis]|uniref:hypothetical protein n=1 Tax=Antarctobacter jejuensis TaxID=1439938 RepID=UPI003FD56D4F